MMIQETPQADLFKKTIASFVAERNFQFACNKN